MIDVKIELRKVAGGWEQIRCVVELHDRHVPVLDIPPRVDEVFPSKDIAISTLKERVAFELEQHHVHESGDDVKWCISTEPAR